MLTQSDANQSLLVYKGGLSLIGSTILQSRDPRVLTWMSATLANLARNAMNMKKLLDEDVLEVLHFCATSTIDALRKNAAWALLFISIHIGQGPANGPCFLPWIRNVLSLSLNYPDSETLNIIQLAFAHFIGVDKERWTVSPLVQRYMVG